MEKNSNKYTFTGHIEDIGEIQVFPREDKPDLTKVQIFVVSEDGQRIYPEFRNKRVKIFKSSNLEIGDKVEITFTHQASRKNGKTYNNLYIYGIKKLY